MTNERSRGINHRAILKPWKPSCSLLRMWSQDLEDPRTPMTSCGPLAFIVNSSVGAGLHILHISSHMQCLPLYQLGTFFSAPSLAFLIKSSPSLLSDFLRPPQKKAAHAATYWFQVLPLCCLPR